MVSVTYARRNPAGFFDAQPLGDSGQAYSAYTIPQAFCYRLQHGVSKKLTSPVSSFILKEG